MKADAYADTNTQRHWPLRLRTAQVPSFWTVHDPRHLHHSLCMRSADFEQIALVFMVGDGPDAKAFTRVRDSHILCGDRPMQRT